MNIFWLDYDLTKAAQYHVDKHVVKMITEYAQILNSAYYYTDEEYYAEMKLAHKNNPEMIWVRQSLSNWNLLRNLGIQLYREYLYRYGFNKEHSSGECIVYLPQPDLPELGITQVPLCMPNECKTQDVVQSYRNYYNRYKRHIFSWKNREVPYWIEN